MCPLGLDIRTLSFITVLFGFGFGAGLLSFGIVHSAYSGLKRVGIGLALIGLAFLLIGLRDHTPPALSIVAANTILALGFVFMNVGIRSFRQLPWLEGWLGILVAVFLLSMLSYSTFVRPSFP